MKQIVVIGGGAAGLMAAITAAEHGAAVTLLEPNERLGKKVNITGKGRCNVTNDCGMDELMQNIPRNSRFLYSAFSRFDGRDCKAYFERLGKKLNITGKGRCNVTNDSNCEELLANVPQNGRFLYSAFSRFDGRDTMAFFEGLGVPLKVERGKRVFPVSDRSFDISGA